MLSMLSLRSLSLIRVLRLVLPLSFVWLAGAAHADEPQYSVEVKLLTLTVGQVTPLGLVFAPKGPWHWNKDYPAKLELAAAGITVARPTLKQQDGDFKVGEAGVDAAFVLTATQAGTTNGTIKGKIGLCDDKVCIIQKVELTVALTATR